MWVEIPQALAWLETQGARCIVLSGEQAWGQRQCQQQQGCVSSPLLTPHLLPPSPQERAETFVVALT